MKTQAPVCTGEEAAEKAHMDVLKEAQTWELCATNTEQHVSL